MSLADTIKRLRIERGWSSGELARQSGVSRAYVYQLEQGVKANPSLEVLEKLAGVLGVSVSDFSEAAPELDVEGVPAGLQAFVRARGRELGVRKSDVEMMRSIRFRGRQPDNPEDWELLFLFLKKWAR